MKKSGSADLRLMGGSIPSWLFDRMTRLCLPLVESILLEYGREEFLRRLSDPFWFQSFGSVIGMDWNSSGVTTAVMSALKKSLSPQAKELGLFVCGGKGKASLETPLELHPVGEATGLDGQILARSSRLTAKVDSTAIQDGFQVYLHYFIVALSGEWTVIQQGMKPESGEARRYHWNSTGLDSFVEDPHRGICGQSQGLILNLTDRLALPTRNAIIDLTRENPDRMIQEIKTLVMPKHTQIQPKDVDIKRLGAVLWLAQEIPNGNFEELLLLKGLGPRTLQSLALISEVIHGTPSRFEDPARFSFAFGSKGGNPFPVPTKVYDETIGILQQTVQKAKIGHSEKSAALKKLTQLAQKAEQSFTPTDHLDEVIRKERAESWKYGGRTIHGFADPQQKLDF